MPPFRASSILFTTCPMSSWDGGTEARQLIVDAVARNELMP
jgi:hypothetical protein